MLEGFGLRAVRDALPDNPVSETRDRDRCDLIFKPMFVLLGCTGAHRWCDSHGYGHRGREPSISNTPTNLTSLQVTQ